MDDCIEFSCEETADDFGLAIIRCLAFGSFDFSFLKSIVLPSPFVLDVADVEAPFFIFRFAGTFLLFPAVRFYFI